LLEAEVFTKKLQTGKLRWPDVDILHSRPPRQRTSSYNIALGG